MVPHKDLTDLNVDEIEKTKNGIWDLGFGGFKKCNFFKSSNF